MSKVKITANKEGKVVVLKSEPSKNGKTYGYFRVEQPRFSAEGGFAKISRISALVTMSKEELDLLNPSAGQELEGKIIVLESFEKKPGFSEKKAGAEGNVLKSGGQTIYRGTAFTTKMDAKDVLIQHDTVAVAVTSESLN